MKKIIFMFLLTLSSFSQAGVTEDKTVNIYLNPLNYFLGTSDVGVDYFINKQHLIGVNYTFIDYEKSNIKYSGSSYGVRYRHFFSETPEDTTWVITAGVGLFDYKSTATASFLGTTLTATGEFDGNYQEVLIGHMWRWEYFNLLLGGGVVNYNSDAKATATAGSTTSSSSAEFDGVTPVLTLDLGIAF